MSHTIEEDSGTVVLRTRHPHNGYYAGDFSTQRYHAPDTSQRGSSAPTPLVSRTA